MIRRRPSPDPPDLGPPLAIPKPRRSERNQGPTDTRGLEHAKAHPARDPKYLEWLRRQPCVIDGKTNRRTGIRHSCWSPDIVQLPNGWMPRSDPMHRKKSYSGRLKRSDHDAIAGCRHAHREEEGQQERFDRDYGIDSEAIAKEMYARYKKERGIEDDE